MSYTPTEKDKNLLLQGVMRISVRIEILNQNGTVYGDLVGTVVGSDSASIDASSHARRQFSFVLVPTKQSMEMARNSLLWLDKEAQLYFGIWSIREKKYYWYSFGKFVFSSMSGGYDATTNQLSVSCLDYYSKIDGTQNGQYGSILKVPAYEEDSLGNPTTYHTIAYCVKTILSQIGKMDKYNIAEIGEYMAMENYNSDWKTYRTNNPGWNYMPYDMEFSKGDTVSTMIEKPLELYPNWDWAFDEDGIFTVKMIPSSYADSVILPYDYIKKILVASDTEQTNVNPLTVKNVCEVWGQVIDTDYYSETVTTSSANYLVTCTGYDAYYTGDKLAIKVSSDNIANQRIKVNSLSAIPIYDESTDAPIEVGKLKSGNVYSFKYQKRYVSGSYVEKFYYLGQWQVHALNVLTDGTVIANGYTDQYGNILDKYSKEYFQAKYNCQNVELEIVPDSPFTVQVIGERVDVKSGSDFDEIECDGLAQVQAKYCNWKNCRLTDTITIKTLMIPWLKEYQKIEYKRANTDTTCQYITQKISHEPSSGTTTIEAYRFYPLYENI